MFQILMILYPFFRLIFWALSASSVHSASATAKLPSTYIPRTLPFGQGSVQMAFAILFTPTHFSFGLHL